MSAQPRRDRANPPALNRPCDATTAHVDARPWNTRTMPRIDADRLLSDLRALRAIGAQGRGVVRPAFSATDMEARRWLKARYEEAGLDATIDGVGNVLGRSRSAGKALLIGSHSDTQPTGGWLDGALGVVYGLEVVRALAADAATRALPVDAVSFQDEEARFVGCLGSRSLIGALTPRDGGRRGRQSRHRAGGCPARGRTRGRAAAAPGSRPLCRLRRTAHRTGPAPRRRGTPDRRRHGHRRPARHPLRVPRPAEPRRHHDDGAAPGCGHRALRARVPHQPGVPESRGRAQRLDHGPRAHRAERDVDRAGLRRAGPAVPRSGRCAARCVRGGRRPPGRRR